MRVFYPISARLADIVNDQARATSGWMMLWSIFCMALLVVVTMTLPAFEAGASGQHDFLSNHQFNSANVVMLNKNAADAHAPVRARKPVYAASTSLRASTQEYIDAHRYVQYFAGAKPVVLPLPPVEPIKSKATVGRYL